eukprot:2147930-Lingulodinium_polyedra.AAC.1
MMSERQGGHGGGVGGRPGPLDPARRAGGFRDLVCFAAAAAFAIHVPAGPVVLDPAQKGGTLG